MALKMTTTIKGVTQEFYIKAINANATNKNRTMVTYSYFADATLSGVNKNAITTEMVEFIAVSDIDIFEQTYIALKKLDKFADAIDC